MDPVLIIAIGNVARGDDGVAHDTAKRLIECGLGENVRLISASGLDVAMTEDLAHARRLLVLDAERREAPPVEVHTLEPGTAAHSGHAIDAPGLLAIVHALYGFAPRAKLVSIAAPEMGHTEALSATARAASEEAARVVLGMLGEDEAS
jgi:hydrogenase maturation protease